MTAERHFTGRVLYVARAPFISGAERALMSMLRHLDRERVEPALVLGYETELIDAARSMDMPVQVVSMPRRSGAGWLSWWRSVRRLGAIIAGFRPDLVHANDVPSCQALSVAAGRRGVARAIHVRWGIGAKDAGWFARGGAECVICISGWVRDQLGPIDGTPLMGAGIEVLHDAVDWPALDVSGPDRIVPPTPTLGFAGQLIEAKGLDLLIEALARMPEARRPRLVVAGRDSQSGGAYEGSLRDLAARRGVSDLIEWSGFLDDVSELYRRVTAVVCPSRVEPLGLVPLEAARFGVPAFANRVGGLVETIEDGRTGWLIGPGDDPGAPGAPGGDSGGEAWAAALADVFDQEKVNRLGRAAREATRLRFSPAVYQHRLMEIYGRMRSAWSLTGRHIGIE